MANETRFWEWVERAARTPFKWGEMDCVLMAADAVKALHGYDPAEGFRGTYHTPIGAYRVIRRLGGLESICSKALGMEVSPNFTQLGDIAIGSFCRIKSLMVDCNARWLVMFDSPTLFPKGDIRITKAFRSYKPCHK